MTRKITVAFVLAILVGWVCLHKSREPWKPKPLPPRVAKRMVRA